jgi:hypothetical protein
MSFTPLPLWEVSFSYRNSQMKDKKTLSNEIPYKINDLAYEHQKDKDKEHVKKDILWLWIGI